MTEVADSVVLAGCALDGRPMTWQVTGREQVSILGSALVTERLCAEGTMLIRRSLRGGFHDPAWLLLDNEIRALARLSRAFPGDQARPFPLLVGYDMDSSDPWALVSDYRGRPAREEMHSLLNSGRMEFATRLFDALARMSLVEVAHNRLNLDGLYLDGTSPYVVTFEHAAFFGEPRSDRPAPASPQDDLVDAGRLLYEVFTGGPALTEPPDLSEVKPLKSPLADLFAEPERRPTAGDVLGRLTESADVPELESGDALRAGRGAFEQARARKFPVDPDPVIEKPARPSARRRFFGKRRRDDQG